MADRSAAVTIRLGVANSETVKAALRGLGRDGQAALKQIEDATKRPSAGMLAFSDTVRSARDQLTGYGASLGPVGAGLSALGTRGLLAAGAIGAGAAAFSVLSQGALQAADRLGQLNDRASEIGVSTDLLQAFEAAGINAGLGADRISAALAKFTVQTGQATAGQGELLEKLRLYAPEAAQQMRFADNQTDRLRILAQAFEGIADPAAKAALEVAAFGRGGIGISRMFAEANGDIDLLIARMREAGHVVDNDLVQQMDEFGDRIESAQDRTWKALVPAFAAVASGIAAGSEGLANLVTRLSSFQVPAWLQFAMKMNPFYLAGKAGEAMWGGSGLTDPVEKNYTIGEAQGPPTDPRSRPGTPIPLRKPAETFEDQDARLAAQREAAEKAASSAKTAGSKAASAADREAATAERELASARQAASRILLELGNGEAAYGIELAKTNDLVAKKALTEDQAAAHMARYRKELDETIAREKERNALLPQTARLASEAGNLTAQVDEALSSGLRDSASTLADITMGTTSAAEGFRNLGNSILKATLEAMYMKTIVAPLAGALSGGLGSLGGLFSGGTTAAVSTSGVGGGINPSPLSYGGPRAAGGPVFPGMEYDVGENGRERFRPSVPGTIIPNSKLGGGGEPQVNVKIENHAGVRVQQRASRGTDGSMNLQVLIRDLKDDIANDIAERRGPVSEAIGRHHGAWRD